MNDDQITVGQSEHGQPEQPKKKRRKAPIIVGAVIVAIAAIGVGMWTWHESPDFCNSVCHTSMDPYVQTYHADAGAAAADKWGNDVRNASAMLVVTHKDEGKACLDCHVPSIGQQLGEVGETITGNYYVPLAEVSLPDLMANSGHDASSGGDAFCLNASCHDMTRDELKASTADMAFNPHVWQHKQNECGEYHKSHRASVLACTECHAESAEIMPDGWVNVSTSRQIEQSQYR